MPTNADRLQCIFLRLCLEVVSHLIKTVSQYARDANPVKLFPVIISKICKILLLKIACLVVETYGNWGKEAQCVFSCLASLLAVSQSSPKPKMVAEIYGRLNLSPVRSVARAIIGRELAHE